VRLGGCEPSSFKHRSNELVVKSEHLIQQLTVLNMVTLLVTIELHVVGHHLFFRDIFEHKEVGLVFVIEVI